MKNVNMTAKLTQKSEKTFSKLSFLAKTSMSVVQLCKEIILDWEEITENRFHGNKILSKIARAFIISIRGCVIVQKYFRMAQKFLSQRNENKFEKLFFSRVDTFETEKSVKNYFSGGEKQRFQSK